MGVGEWGLALSTPTPSLFSAGRCTESWGCPISTYCVPTFEPLQGSLYPCCLV